MLPMTRVAGLGIFGCAVTLLTAAADSSFSTQWMATDPINSSWIRHASWTDGIPDGDSTAVLEGIRREDGQLQQYEVVLSNAGINGKGDHPAGVVELTYGAAIIIEQGGALDFSGQFDLGSVIKKFGRPPATKVGGRDWGGAADNGAPPGSAGDADADDDDDGSAKGSVSGGSIAGIVAALVLVLVGVAVFALWYTKRKPAADRSLELPPPSVHNPMYSADPGTDGTYMAPSAAGMGFYDAANLARRQLAEESEIYDPVYTSNPLSGLESTEVVSLERAVAAAAQHCGGGPYDGCIEKARNAYDERFPAGIVGGGREPVLAKEDGAVMHVYSQETGIYRGLNGALGGYGVGGRDAILHYHELIKLMLISTRKLPSVKPVTVYRGVQVDADVLLGGASVGDRITWWGFTSTTRSPDSVDYETGDMVPSDIIYSAIDDDIYDFEPFEVYSGLSGGHGVYGANAAASTAGQHYDTASPSNTTDYDLATEA
eukprot:gene5384-4612_t